MGKQPRTRTRIMITVTVAVLALMGLWVYQAGAVLYNDGLTHTVDGESCIIFVQDSPEGESTTVNVVEPATISIRECGVDPDPTQMIKFQTETFSLVSQADPRGQVHR